MIEFFSDSIISCSLLTFSEDLLFFQSLVQHNCSFTNVSFKLLFKASIHGYGAGNFHNICDEKNPTLTIIKSDFGNIFGGFTEIPWKSTGNLGWFDAKAFLFLIRSKNIVDQQIVPLFLIKKDDALDSYAVCRVKMLVQFLEKVLIFMSQINVMNMIILFFIEVNIEVLNLVVLFEKNHIYVEKNFLMIKQLIANTLKFWIMKFIKLKEWIDFYVK